MKNIILINREFWETRVAVLQDNVLQDLYFDKDQTPSIEKCFIKGKINNVLPGLQTAFVDIGQTKAGFLHISEIDRNLAQEKMFEQNQDGQETFKRKNVHKSQIPIANIFKNKEEILVQVKKEATGDKGPKLTTCYTIPGKYIVLLANIEQIAVSTKIESRPEKMRLKELVDSLLPEGMGAIIRTDAEGKSEKDLTRDIKFLVSSWDDLMAKYKQAKTGDILFSDLPIAARMVREHINDEEQYDVYCDNPTDIDDIKNFLSRFMPDNKVRLHLQTRENLFESFEVDKQINQLLERKVFLPSGGNIVIEHTEAMTVVDVNTAKFVGKTTQEDTTLKANLEAAKEVVRQLRLRNIGGIVVIDFIDMHKQVHKQTLMSFLSEELKQKDKLKSMTLKLSELGLIQMTRKKVGKTLLQQMAQTCCSCKGLGVKKSLATLSFEILRKLKNQIVSDQLQGKKIELAVSTEMFEQISKNEFSNLMNMEKMYSVKIMLNKNNSQNPSDIKIRLM